LEAFPKYKEKADHPLFFNPKTHKPIKRGQAWKIITAICEEVGLTG
jgi:hypothetical protein